MFSLPYMRYLVPALTVTGIFALATYAYYTYRQAEYFFSGPMIISVEGTGEVTVVPDIATFSFSVYAEGADAEEAQSQSAEAINAILDYLKDQDIEEKDIKTQNYNLNPRYEWDRTGCDDVLGYCQGERVLLGYEVTQSVQVKVRDTDKAGDIMSGVGERGATNISSLQFTVDDEDMLKAEARENAIKDARAKAEKLADDLDVDIVRMTSFWEDQNYMPYAKGGYGMDMMVSGLESSSIAPEVPVGENTVTATVSISYEMR